MRGVRPWTMTAKGVKLAITRGRGDLPVVFAFLFKRAFKKRVNPHPVHPSPLLATEQRSSILNAGETSIRWGRFT